MKAFIELNSFITSAKMKSFSKAARHLGLTPSAVSKHIQKLEEELGVRLFSRSTRKITLTDQGQSFLEMCEDPAQKLFEASQVISDSKLEPSGTLRITCATDYGRTYIVPQLKNFVNEYPKIKCDLVLTDSISDLIGDNYDVSIRIGPKLVDSSFISRKLSDISLITCASPSYIKKNGEPKKVQDLDEHQCISIKIPRTGKTLDWSFLEKGKTTSYKVSDFLSTNDPEAMRVLALNDAGIIQTGHYAVANDLKKGQLVQIFPKKVIKSWSAFICYPSKKNLSLKTRTFVDFITKNIKE